MAKKISWKDLVRRAAGPEPKPITYEFHDRVFKGPVKDKVTAGTS